MILMASFVLRLVYLIYSALIDGIGGLFAGSIKIIVTDFHLFDSLLSGY